MIKHGLVVLLQDYIAFFEEPGSNFLVECLLDEVLVQLSMAHYGHALFIYHV